MDRKVAAVPPKRRKLMYSKCSQCRTDKKRAGTREEAVSTHTDLFAQCSPSERQWPQRCDRCIERDFPCSANASLTRSKRSKDRAERPAPLTSSIPERRSKSPVDASPTPDWGKWKSFAVRALNNERAISAAVECKIDINIQDDNGWTALHWAAVRGDVDAVRFLIAAGANSEAQEKCGATALHYAAHRGSVAVAQQLLDVGADANKPDAWGWIPLHEAAENGHIEVATLLLQNGANTEAKNNISGDTPLLLAVTEGHLEIVRSLIRHDADPNTCNKSRITPLMAATTRRTLDIARAVLCSRTVVNAQDERGSTALHYLLRDQDQDDDRLRMAETLVRANASLDIQDDRRETPLDNLRGLDAEIYADELRALRDEILLAQQSEVSS